MHLSRRTARPAPAGAAAAWDGADGFRLDPRWPRGARDAILGFVLRACATLAIIAGAALVYRIAYAGSPQPLVRQEAGSKPAVPAWIDVNRPIHLFGLSGSEFNRLSLNYRARRREDTNEREDLLAYGVFGERSAFLSLSILRRAQGSSSSADFFVGMARLAAEQHISVMTTSVPNLLPTRFGSFVTADLTLANSSTSLPCLGFHLEALSDTAPVDIAGLACRPAGSRLDRATIACVLDRIDLLSAGDDDSLRGFFVDAERRRNASCAPSPLLAAGSRQVWLDSDASPVPMRHLIGSRVR